MHPQTGELFSRRTGKLVTKLEAVESSKLRIFQNVAAQIYYGSHLPVSTDRALVSAQTHMRLGRSGKRVRSVGLSSTPASSPVPILAPRPDEATNGGVNWILQASGNNTGKSVEEEKEEAKREAKRIKNRMSAARSNQKRRLHLESQRRELASLSGRVEELQGKKKQILEENEKLRKQLLKA